MTFPKWVRMLRHQMVVAIRLKHGWWVELPKYARRSYRCNVEERQRRAERFRRYNQAGRGTKAAA